MNTVDGGEDLVANVCLEGKECRVLVDTGSQISLITRSITGMNGVRPSPFRILGVTGHRMWNYGEKLLIFSVSDVKYDAMMQVVDNLGGYDAIIGLDFLVKYKCVIDIDGGILKVRGQRWPLNKSAKAGDREVRRMERSDIRAEGLVVRLNRAERVPPRCEKMIQIQISNRERLYGLEVVTEPCFDGVEGCAVARGLCKVNENNSVIIQVANFGEEELILQKGTALATLSECYEGKGVVEGMRRVNRTTTSEYGSSDLKFAEKLNHLNDVERDALLPVLEEFKSLFCPKETPPATDIIQHHISTGSAKPIYQKPYRTPHHQKPLVENFVREQLEAGIIEPSESPWSSPVVIVPKKSTDGMGPKYRFCVDFRRLNAVTIPDVYPIPNIVDTLDHLGGCTYFTTLDLTSGYYQIPMHPESRSKTGFIVESGHYEYTRMPFGLRNAPATFQKMMDGVLRGLKPSQCMVYLDDVIIFSNGVKEHAERLRRVFEKLREAKLSLKFDKCNFALSEVKYLGHIISRTGVHPDPEKIEAVQNFPIPSNVKELQSFLGLSNYYRRFVNGYAVLARPLTRLLKKGTAFMWSPDCQEAINNLKDALTRSPVLVYPDFSKPFILSTDASNFAIGAVLSQECDGEEHPCAYASRQLSSPEVSYATTEKELLAVVWGVSHFRCYLYGRKFKIITDHAALKWLFSLKDPSSRLLRWTLKLGEYDYEVTHKPGKKHLNADALSRKVRQVNISRDQEIIDMQRADEECQKWRSQKGFEEERGILKKLTDKGRQIVVPRPLRLEVLRQCHDHPLAGHMGVRPTLSRIREMYWWPSLRRDCEEYLKGCVSCHQRSPYGKTKATLQELPAAERPFDFVAIDVVGPLPRAENGDRYILSILDHFSRYLEMVAIPDQTSETVAAALVRRWILKYGVPDVILSDQGTNFMSELFSQVCKLLRIKRLRTSPSHPETNGRIERVHRSIAKIISHYVNSRHTDWNEWLPYAVSAYNSSEHTSVGYTPHQVVFGNAMRSPFECVARHSGGLNEGYVPELEKKLKRMWEICRNNSKRARRRQEKQYNKQAKDVKYHCGQWVYLSDQSARTGQARKLTKLWRGPYEVIGVIPPTCVKLRLPNRVVLVHKNRLKPHPGATVPPSCLGGERRRGRPRNIQRAEDETQRAEVPPQLLSPTIWEEGEDFHSAESDLPLPQRASCRDRSGAGDEEWTPGAGRAMTTQTRSPYNLRPRKEKPVEEIREPRCTSQPPTPSRAERVEASSPLLEASMPTEDEHEEPSPPSTSPCPPYALRSLGPPPAPPGAV